MVLPSTRYSATASAASIAALQPCGHCGVREEDGGAVEAILRDGKRATDIELEASRRRVVSDCRDVVHFSPPGGAPICSVAAHSIPQRPAIDDVMPRKPEFA